MNGDAEGTFASAEESRAAAAPASTSAAFQRRTEKCQRKCFCQSADFKSKNISKCSRVVPTSRWLFLIMDISGGPQQEAGFSPVFTTRSSVSEQSDDYESTTQRTQSALKRGSPRVLCQHLRRQQSITESSVVPVDFKFTDWREIIFFHFFD